MSGRLGGLSRRELLKIGAGVSLASLFQPLEGLAQIPLRKALAATQGLPSIQFDIGNFLTPATTMDGVEVRFGTDQGKPLMTLFLPATLARRPTMADQAALETALQTIEQVYPFSPQGVMTVVSYGVPYFNMLAQGGLSNPQVAAQIPKLLDTNGQPTNRLALEEAVAGPTDVSPNNPGITKQKFNVPVKIEQNHVLFTLRSDSMDVLTDVFMYLNGAQRLNQTAVPATGLNGLFQFQQSRMNFVQPGLPRKVADANKLPFAAQIHPDSPMWMGFADQHTTGAGPAEICTFLGNSSLKLTTAQPNDYFAQAGIQHLSHVIMDMAQYYKLPDPSGATAKDRTGEPYSERIQYMFRSNPPPSMGYDQTKQFTDGGGPAFIPNVYSGREDALANAAAQNTVGGQNRMGHLCALHRSSRALDGTAAHIRWDGPGFNSVDVPDGSNQPSLEFSIFVPTCEFFRQLRVNSASLDLVQQHKVDPNKNGLERFLTATRRQNFMVPPRAHRSFCLLEVIGAQ